MIIRSPQLEDSAQTWRERPVAAEILDYARRRNVSRILLGRARPRPWWRRFWREDVARAVAEDGRDFEVTVVSEPQREADLLEAMRGLIAEAQQPQRRAPGRPAPDAPGARGNRDEYPGEAGQ